ncbi:MAG: winged helix-turn-helix domain-containing protein [Pseudomonadota bacterium]
MLVVSQYKPSTGRSAGRVTTRIKFPPWVLDAVKRNSAMTQHTVSRELGIALGLVNAYLKRCV